MAVIMPERLRELAAAMAQRVPGTRSSVRRETSTTIGPLAPNQSPFGAWDRDAVEPAAIEPGDLLSVGKAATKLGAFALSPLGVGLLRFLDLGARRIAPLARERMATTLAKVEDPSPDRIWRFLQAHPRVVSVEQVPRIPRPPGWPSQPTGHVLYPQVGATDPLLVEINRQSRDRAGALAGQLVRAAVELSGRRDHFLPGIHESLLGALPLRQRYGVEGLDAALFPHMFSDPRWVGIHDREQALRALESWFPPLPVLPPTGGVR